MELRDFLDLRIKPQDDASLVRWIVDIKLANKDVASEILETFKKHGYNISAVPGSFLRVFTKNEKEVAELDLLLTEIDGLDFQVTEGVNLKDVFKGNLRYEIFTKSFVEKLKYCMKKSLPFLYEDNTFIAELYDNQKFAAYSMQIPVSNNMDVSDAQTSTISKENVMEQVKLEDPEDIGVRQDILYTLTNITESNQGNYTLNFLIGNIISNISGVIAADNKQYRLLGTRHLVESALQGVNITPELQIELDEKVLSAFSDLTVGQERGA